MNELAEIEKEYVKNIVEFFCRKSLETILLSPSGKATGGGVFSYQLSSWIENHLRRRLFEKDFIINYDINVYTNNLADVRDYKIDSVLGNESKEPRNYIRVNVRYKDRTFDQFDYYIERHQFGYGIK